MVHPELAYLLRRLARLEARYDRLRKLLEVLDN